MSCKPLSSAACRFRLCAALLASGRFDIIITNTFDCRGMPFLRFGQKNSDYRIALDINFNQCRCRVRLRQQWCFGISLRRPRARNCRMDTYVILILFFIIIWLLAKGNSFKIIYVIETYPCTGNVQALRIAVYILK